MDAKAARRTRPGRVFGPRILAGGWSPLLVASLAALIAGWAMLNLAAGDGFVLFVSDKLRGEEEAVSALARIFAALVLFLLSAEESGRRLGWVAAGLVVLGFGNLSFGYLEPLLEGGTGIQEGLYEALIPSTLACALLAVGLFAASPPRIPIRFLLVSLAAISMVYVLAFEVFEAVAFLPPLARTDSLVTAVDLGSPLLWLTPWHWALSALPLGLAVVATAGALRRNREGTLPVWLAPAMVFLAGSLLHEYVWPSGYSGNVVTSADLLRLAFGAILAVGGILELRRLASERAALLAAEQERTRRLGELAALKADFSAMVAHELCGPVAAVRTLTEMLRAADTAPEFREYAMNGLDRETDALDALISDVRAAAAVERDDFEVRVRPLPLAELLSDARAYAGTLPGAHPVRVLLEEVEGHERVLADPHRVRQVLRNLLSNAAKYSPEGTPVEVSAAREDGRVRIEVTDHGPGIAPEDLARIFEKFGRGRDRDGRKVPGVGLGLYLSRRIVRAHGAELAVRTEPGKGSGFYFDLEVVG